MGKKRAPRTRWGRVKELEPGKFWAAEPLGAGKYKAAPDTFDTRTEAEAWLRKREHEVETAAKANPVTAILSQKTFEYFWNKWLGVRKERMEAKNPTITPSTYADYDGIGRNYLVPFFGSYIISEIDEDAVKALQKALTDAPPRPAQKAENMASWIMEYAIREGAISKNPFGSENVVRNNQTFHRELCDITADMVEVCASATVRNSLAIYLGAYMGLRAGECWGIKIKNVHLAHKRLYIEHALSEVSNKLIQHADQRARKGVRIGPPKPQRVKYLDIPEFLIPKFEEHLKKRNGGPDEWLFVTEGGLPMRHSAWYLRQFVPAAEEAGFPPEGDFHTLRHFCASWYLLQSVPGFIVQKMLDHTDAEMTRLYSHLLPGVAAAWMDRASQQYRQEEKERSRRRFSVVTS